MGCRNSVRLLSLLMLCLIPAIALADKANYEPRAVELLQKMFQAYGNLTALEQKSEFSVTTIPMAPAKSPFGIPPRADFGTAPPPVNNEPPKTDDPQSAPASPDERKDERKPEERKLDQRMRLLFSAPNRLRLEVQDTDPAAGKPLTSLWLSDGKIFWSYIPEKNWYTREKAPGKMRDFSRLKNLNTTNLELMMLMGVNPFADLKQIADNIHYVGTETVRGSATEVVALSSSSRREETEVRLYIGKSDGLLHRLVHEVTPVAGPAVPGKVGDALDELVDVQQPPTLPDPDNPTPAETPRAQSFGPFRTRLTYDNILSSAPSFANDAFQFTIPTGALMYGATENASKKKKAGLDRLREFWKRNRIQ